MPRSDAGSDPVTDTAARTDAGGRPGRGAASRQADLLKGARRERLRIEHDRGQWFGVRHWQGRNSRRSLWFHSRWLPDSQRGRVRTDTVGPADGLALSIAAATAAAGGPVGGDEDKSWHRHRLVLNRRGSPLDVACRRDRCSGNGDDRERHRGVHDRRRRELAQGGQ